MAKRIRSINWDEEEKQLFRSVLKDYSQIIEDKTLSTNTNKAKVKAWDEVHKKFNSLNSRARDLSQLKIQWKCMKMSARKEWGKYKKDINKTGGGAKPPTPDNTSIEINDLLNPAELLVDTNIYDSDGIVINSESSTKMDIILVKDTDIDTEIYAQPPLQDPKISLEQMDTDKNTQIQIQEINKSIEEPVLDMSLSTTKTRMKPARKQMQGKTRNTALKSHEDYREDYINRMTLHSQELKEREHARRMEMAKEKHIIEVDMLKLKRRILEEELKKFHEVNK